MNAGETPRIFSRASVLIWLISMRLSTIVKVMNLQFSTSDGALHPNQETSDAYAPKYARQSDDPRYRLS
jgi:hypothetical protein